jgi:glycosyltransferase involved in cell wall biosynthesis
MFTIGDNSHIMKPTIIFVSSHPLSVTAFMLPHIRALSEVANVQVFANTNERTLLQDRGVDILIDTVPIVRPIALFLDLKALWVLFWRFKSSRALAVHTFTPKAGLLGMLAAWLARVPLRVHSFTGQVWVTRSGAMRWLLIAADKCIAAMATDLLVDSSSQRAFLINQGIVNSQRSAVLGAGSICGVDILRFCPSEVTRMSVREELGTATDTLVCLYLGRLNRDKGVLDLALAFEIVHPQYPKVELWVVGPDEDNSFEQMQNLLGNAICQVKRVGFTDQPERFMQAADLFCLPSYREGFGSSVIEAAACGLPTLSSRIYGLTDALAEGQTGWMHEAGNFQDLAHKLNNIIANPADLMAKGQAARVLAVERFAEKSITDEMVKFYIKRLNETAL